MQTNLFLFHVYEYSFLRRKNNNSESIYLENRKIETVQNQWINITPEIWNFFSDGFSQQS